MCRKQNRGQRPPHITCHGRDTSGQHSDHPSDEVCGWGNQVWSHCFGTERRTPPRGATGRGRDKVGGWGTRRPDVSGNELPMTQEWRGPGQISCGDTQRAVVGSGLVFGRDGTGVKGRRPGGRTPRMGALRQAYTTPHTLSEDATRNHWRVGYQINRESPNTKMVRRSGNVAVSGPLAESGHRVHNMTFRPALLVTW